MTGPKERSRLVNQALEAIVHHESGRRPAASAEVIRKLGGASSPELDYGAGTIVCGKLLLS